MIAATATADTLTQSPPKGFQPSVSVEIAFLPAKALHDQCAGSAALPSDRRASFRTSRIEGCAEIGSPSDPGRVFVADPCKARGRYAEVLCHELAHALGWPPDHPKQWKMEMEK